MRYGIFVFNPDGDMGFGEIVGAFKSADIADKKADTIRRVALHKDLPIECVTVTLTPGSVSAHDLVERVQ